MDIAALALLAGTGDERAVESYLRSLGWRPPRPQLPLDVLRERFLAQTKMTGDCRLWTGPQDAQGYGRFQGRGAHRVAWELFVGPIEPRTLVVDHCVCFIKLCTAIPHLQTVTAVRNTELAIERGQQSPDQRVHNGGKQWCKRGHDLTNPVFCYVAPDGKRYCRVCRSMHQQRYRSK